MDLHKRVSILHLAINQLVAGNLTTLDTNAQERADIVMSAFVSAFAEAIIGMNISPELAIDTLRVQLERLRQ